MINSIVLNILEVFENMIKLMIRGLFYYMVIFLNNILNNNFLLFELNVFDLFCNYICKIVFGSASLQFSLF